MAQPTGPIRIIEVGPRDGLQNEPRPVPTEAKVAFINALARTGVGEIEAGAFVSPRAVPQLADSDDVFRKIERVPGVTYSALVPNQRGLERARAAGVQKIAVFTAASETFVQRNIRATIQESLDRFKPVVAAAKREGMATRGYVSSAVFCPYEGRIPPARVLEVTRRLLDLGVEEISLGDTIGKASPADVRRLLDAVLPHLGRAGLALHFHDTYGMAVANALTAWGEYGLTAFDSSAGGLGGCPYAPGATGNVATEDLVYALKASGATVLVDELRVVDAARQLSAALGHALRSHLAQVCGPGPDKEDG
ncbi:hydroxymethylglutaryl-CoA lyase [Nitrospira sp. Kam-Ns4a]